MGIRFNKGGALIPAFVLVSLTLLLRALLIGDAPYTDEGFYIYISNYAAFSRVHHPEITSILPKDPLLLYPSLLFWLSYIPGPPFLYWRIADALVASGAAAAIFIFLRRHTGAMPAFFGAAIWTVAFNHHEFIHAGFRNSIGAATLFLFLGLCAFESEQRRYNAFLCGCLVAFAVLLRETFFGQSLVVGVYVLTRSGGRKALEYAIGGIIAGAAVLALFAALKGGLIEGAVGIVEGYRSTYRINSFFIDVLKWDLMQMVRDSAIKTAGLLAWMLPISIIGIFAVFSRRVRHLRHLALLGLLIMLPPGWDIFNILCFPYRFAQLCVGASIFAALGFVFIKGLLEDKGLKKAGVGACVLLCAWAVYGSLEYWKTSFKSWKDSFYFAPVMLAGDWNSPVVADSFYLDAAHKIMKNTAENDRILVSGYNYGLYPLTRRIPYSYEMADTTAYEMANRTSWNERVARMFSREMPELITVTNRFPGDISIEHIYPAFKERYKSADTVATGKRSHGGVGAALWTRSD